MYMPEGTPTWEEWSAEGLNGEKGEEEDTVPKR